MRSGLLGLAAAGLMLVAASAAPFAEPAQSEPPPPVPTAVCAPAPPSRLITHLRARVLTDDPRPLNLRDAPGTKGNVLAQIPSDSVLYVLEGPRCSQNYAWYRVEYHGLTGWIAEGDSTAYFVGVYPPGW
ncbi:MAG TPA: SH3 domain-containing protein [Phototrophicaceae bacterium]|nr:SH3 domain-containing protein [Phototrophicaceae bacterium]